MFAQCTQSWPSGPQKNRTEVPGREGGTKYQQAQQPIRSLGAKREDRWTQPVRFITCDHEPAVCKPRRHSPRAPTFVFVRGRALTKIAGHCRSRPRPHRKMLCRSRLFPKLLGLSLGGCFPVAWLVIDLSIYLPHSPRRGQALSVDHSSASVLRPHALADATPFSSEALHCPRVCVDVVEHELLAAEAVRHRRRLRWRGAYVDAIEAIPAGHWLGHLRHWSSSASRDSI